MKKLVLLLFILISQQLIAKDNPISNWELYLSGKYYKLRPIAFDHGVEELLKGNYKKAAELSRKSLTCSHKFNFPAYNNYAIAQSKNKHFQQCEGLLLKSIEKGGDRSIGNYNIFINRFNQRNYADAGEYFDLLPNAILENHPIEAGNYLVNIGQLDNAYYYFQIGMANTKQRFSSGTYFNASLAAWAVHDTNFAISKINSAISEDGGIARYHIQKAKMYLGIDAGVSQNEFSKAIRLEPMNEEARLGMARACVSNGNFKKALDIIEHHIEQKNGKVSADWYQLKAVSLANLGDYEKAFEAINILKSMRATLTAYDYKVLGDIYLNADSLESAETNYTYAMRDTFIGDVNLGLSIVSFLNDDFDKAEQILNNLHQTHPEYELSSYGYYLEAMIYYAAGRQNKFESSIEKASFGKSKESSKLLIQAMRAMSQYNYNLAKKYLKKGLALDPENINLNLAMGSLCFQNGENEEACQIFDKCLKLEPNNMEVKNMKALCLSDLNKTDEAIKLMAEVLKVKPTARYYNNMAMIYAMVKVPDVTKQGDYCGYFETAQLYLDSAFAMGLDTVFSLNTANCQLSLMDTTKAMEMFLANSNGFFLNNAAVVNFMSFNQEDAENQINKAVEAFPYKTPMNVDYNKHIINNRSQAEPTSLIYLYQYLPSVLPSKHQLSYTFQMNSEPPVHVDGDFIVYTTLDIETCLPFTKNIFACTVTK